MRPMIAFVVLPFDFLPRFSNAVSEWLAKSAILRPAPLIVNMHDLPADTEVSSFSLKKPRTMFKNLMHRFGA